MSEDIGYQDQVQRLEHDRDKAKRRIAELEAELAERDTECTIEAMMHNPNVNSLITQHEQTIGRLRSALESSLTSLESSWKLIPNPKEGELVVYVGVHAVRWKSEYGEPTVAFVQNSGEPAEEEPK